MHLGAPNSQQSLQRETRFIKWLDQISHDANELFLVGDVFDFWFEYREVIPKGYLRLFSKLLQLKESGVKIHYFIGNHDMWVFDYFTKELGFEMHREPIQIERQGKQLYVGHGDGLGPGDYGYKFIKQVFRNPVCIWLFKWLHPDIGIWLGKTLSSQSRKVQGNHTDKFLGEDKEWLYQYCVSELKTRHFDYFIFGHRHLPIEKKLNERSKYINLGDWIQFNTYARFDGEDISLLTFSDN